MSTNVIEVPTEYRDKDCCPVCGETRSRRGRYLCGFKGIEENGDVNTLIVESPCKKKPPETV